MLGIIGYKRGMTRIFQEDGRSVPVTVIEAEPNRISQIKTIENDGYAAIQVLVGQQATSRINKPQINHLAKAAVEPGKASCEFRITDSVDEPLNLGDALTVAQFEVGQKVDVSGVSKGKGFAGTVKRHNFRTQDATHGNSLSHRVPGSTGQNQTPGRVFKGKKMAGQMGHVNVTAQNLEVVSIDLERHLLLIKGAVPGAPGQLVKVKSGVKQRANKR